MKTVFAYIGSPLKERSNTYPLTMMLIERLKEMDSAVTAEVRARLFPAAQPSGALAWIVSKSIQVEPMPSYSTDMWSDSVLQTFRIGTAGTPTRPPPTPVFPTMMRSPSFL